MELHHEFVVPVGVAQAWEVLLDLERIAPCMPGATLEQVQGDEFTGKVKVKLGAVQVTYNGKGRFTSKDEAARTAVIEASGKEARGSGTAKATITARLFEDGSDSTRVTVTTDLAITGRPAQFGRGVMTEVGNKLLGQFAECLADTLGTTETPAGEAAAAATVDDEGPAPSAMVPPPGPPAASEQLVTATIAEPPPAGAAIPAQSSSAPGGAATAAASSSPGGTGTRGGTAASQTRTTPQPAAARPTSDTIDLLEVVGPSIAKRLLPVAAALAVLALIWAVIRRRR